MTAPRSLTVGVGLLLATVLGGLLLGGAAPAEQRPPRQSEAGHVARNPPAPADSSAEVGFARDMAVHHQQAVEMSLHVYRHGAAARVRTLAYDIAQTQATQRGMMLGWLDLWGRTPSAKQPMAWMDMPPPSDADRRAGKLMPGMLSTAELDQLLHSRGARAERLFLRRMISHHRGGVHMARGAVERAHHPVVVRLAPGMLEAQQAEIDEMTRLLRAGGGAPPSARPDADARTGNESAPGHEHHPGSGARGRT